MKWETPRLVLLTNLNANGLAEECSNGYDVLLVGCEDSGALPEPACVPGITILDLVR